MIRQTLPVVLLLIFNTAFAQDYNPVQISVKNPEGKPAAGALVEMYKEGKLFKTAIAERDGIANFTALANGLYRCNITLKGCIPYNQDSFAVPMPHPLTVQLKKGDITLQGVTVSSKKNFIQQVQGKTILNVEASPSNAGTTVLEVLEKSPGVTVDKNGSIAMQGKQGVLILIDDKPTYLSGAELNNMLSSMSSSQVEQIELMPNPPAKYDASGNAGIINIKTKKSKIKGFNGTAAVTALQGVYPKNNNSIVLNYRNGKFNFFTTYSLNLNKYFTDIYALRKYYDKNGNITATLDQPTTFAGNAINHTLRSGIDYFASQKTTLGIMAGGTLINRSGDNEAKATWLSAANTIDSAVATNSTSDNNFKNGLVNLNLRRSFSSKHSLAADADWLGYIITNRQQFYNRFQAAGGYTEASNGDVKSSINIFSAKADYNNAIDKNTAFSAGYKTSHTQTDNNALFQNLINGNWQNDYGKSNHFLYNENIHAVYTSYETRIKKLNLQGGLRYEYTQYTAHQLGNAQQKDSAFSRNYGALFPNISITAEADSNNQFTIAAGRRIDRPAFQKLNPFFFLINKYTYQTGNPFYQPQFSWNMQLTHQYKQLLTTTFSYSLIKNYFSQLFLTDTVSGLLFYSEGNVGKAYNLGTSVALQLSPFKWWTLNAQLNYNYKHLKGYNGNENFTSYINQFNINLNNQFSFARVYTAELSGFYTGRARNDLQEVLYPTGQLSLGVSRPVLKKKGTLRFIFRDVFFTNAMEGLTTFATATEYFILKRDSRVAGISFTWKFGKAYKATKRSQSSVSEEMERVGNG